MRTLVVDVGGSNAKAMLGRRRWKVPSGQDFNAAEMVKRVLALVPVENFDRVSLGLPCVVRKGRPLHEPINIGNGWMRIDFDRAFGRPVRIINDAAMQALGNYRRGRMLFIGLGTSIGATLIAEDRVVPLQIGLLRLSRKGPMLEVLSKKALKKAGKEKWSESVRDAVELLRDVFFPDDLVIGGGNSGEVEPFPAKCRRVSNRSAFLGGLRLWEDADMCAVPLVTTWQIRRRPK